MKKDFWIRMLEKARHRWITINIQNTDWQKKQERQNRNMNIQNFIKERINKYNHK